MTERDSPQPLPGPPPRPAGWQHHPGRAPQGPLDQHLEIGADARHPGLQVDLVFTADGVYLPLIARQPPGPGPFPVIIAIHGGSGGLGIPYLVDHVRNQGWALDAMLARGYAVVFAEGRMEHEDAYGTGVPFVLDHNDMVTVLRFVQRQPWADPDRIGFFGVSHGGEMQMKLIAELAHLPDVAAPAALAMCEPAVIEFLGLKYAGARKEANLQFNRPVGDQEIDLARALERIRAIPDTLPMLVAGRDEDHLQGLFKKLRDMLREDGKAVEWATFSYPDHAYQFGPRRTPDGYKADAVQQATLAAVLAFLDRHVRDRA